MDVKNAILSEVLKQHRRERRDETELRRLKRLLLALERARPQNNWNEPR